MGGGSAKWVLGRAIGSFCEECCVLFCVSASVSVCLRKYYVYVHFSNNGMHNSESLSLDGRWQC